MVSDSGLVCIEDCAFTLAVGKRGNIPGSVFGGAITISGRAVELTVRRNRFFGKAIVPGGVVCGVLAAVNSRVITTALASANIEQNDFEQLNAGIVAFARLGEVRCAGNRMRSVNTGIFLADSIAGATNAFVNHAAGKAQAHPELAELVTAAYPARFMASVSAEPRADPPGAPEKKAALSRSVRTATLKKMTSSGIAAFDALTAARTNAAGAAAGTDARAAASRASARPAASAAGATAKAERAQLVNDIAHLDTIAVTAAAVLQPVTAVLRVENNDIVLVNTDAKAQPGTGVAILRSPSDDRSMLLMSSNRVMCGDNRTLGGSLWFVTMATVTGNMLVHPPGGRTDLPVFASIGAKDGRYAIDGNLFYRGARILPPRTTPPPNQSDYWPFLNTEL
jgi:hypothetical protein